MKTRLVNLILALVIIFPLALMAQEKKEVHKEKKKEIDLKKIAFITEKLSLTTEEAQAFWPVYNDFQKKKEECMKQNRGKNAPVDYDKLTEKELNELADADIIRATKMLELRKQYNADLKKVLPIKKVVMLYDAEREFRKVLVKDLRLERKNNKAKEYVK